MTTDEERAAVVAAAKSGLSYIARAGELRKSGKLVQLPDRRVALAAREASA